MITFGFRKSTFMATYSHIILPTNGPQLWPISTTEPINPPAERRTIGRPKKNRNKANDEPKNPHILPRDLPTVKCTKCRKMGHNRRTCGGNRVLPKGGNKVLIELIFWLEFLFLSCIYVFIV